MYKIYYELNKILYLFIVQGSINLNIIKAVTLRISVKVGYIQQVIYIFIMQLKHVLKEMEKGISNK